MVAVVNIDTMNVLVSAEYTRGFQVYLQRCAIKYRSTRGLQLLSVHLKIHVDGMRAFAEGGLSQSMHIPTIRKRP